MPRDDYYTPQMRKNTETTTNANNKNKKHKNHTHTHTLKKKDTMRLNNYSGIF